MLCAVWSFFPENYVSIMFGRAKQTDRILLQTLAISVGSVLIIHAWVLLNHANENYRAFLLFQNVALLRMFAALRLWFVVRLLIRVGLHFTGDVLMLSICVARHETFASFTFAIAHFVVIGEHFLCLVVLFVCCDSHARGAFQVDGRWSAPCSCGFTARRRLWSLDCV